MRHLKTFESFSFSSEEELQQKINFISKFKTSLTGSIPEMEDLLEDLDNKKQKYPEAYEEIKSNLEKYKSIFKDIKEVKSPSSDQRFTFTEDNFLAIAAYFNFNVMVLKPLKVGGNYIMQMKQKGGVGKSTGHSRQFIKQLKKV